MRVSTLILASAFRLASAAVSISADSYDQTVPNPPQLALDGNHGTIWHSQWTPNAAPLPHHVDINLGENKFLNGFTYLPRQDEDGTLNGNVGNYQLSISTDGNNWNQVASGTFIDDRSLKYIGFTGANLQYFRFTALSEAGNRGPWTSAAEFGFSPAPTEYTHGQWGPVIPMPLVPAGGFLEWNTGKILTFSSYRVNDFQGSGLTYTATYDPATGAVSQRTVVNTAHDMFCPGLTTDSLGRMIVTGGDDSSKTSIYDPTTGNWIIGATMKQGRGYQSSCSISDGRIFTIGGSWSGGEGNKNGEVYSQIHDTWTQLPGCPVAPMLTNDAQGVYRSDNHAWLFSWKNGYVFQAGPSKAMNWYGVYGATGSQQGAGNRANDGDSMNGNAVMYDAWEGKILTMGGAPSYQDSDATANVHVITIGDPNTIPQVTKVASMAHPRAFANAVVLPNGKVFVTGGETHAVPFDDNTAVLEPELYDPDTHTWTTLPAHTVPRTYHSIALLMTDGRVFTGGGGLCGTCTTNHEDAQIYSPEYLFNTMGGLATRPKITNAPNLVQLGTTYTITTDVPCTTFSLIKFGSATHAVDTDQRRIPMRPIATNGLTYTFSMPGDGGVAVAGYWMMFALNSGGVPSIASTIRVTITPGGV